MKNEPVFPNQILTTDWKEKTEWHQHYQFVGGLTKREYFAALAMQGCIAYGGLPINDKDKDTISHYSVQVADRLIAELSKNKHD